MIGPVGSGSVSMRLYPHDAAGPEVVELLRREAAGAEAAGFDGVMISEHHGGFAGYLPNPVQACGFVLDATDSIWAAPCPLVLPIRAATQVSEDLAWLAARFPRRVGAGFCAGGLAMDFEMAGVEFERNADMFKHSLPEVVGALRGDAESPLADDAAVADLAHRPVPSVSAVASPAAARRAASLDIGILFDSLQTAERTRRLTDEYREAGGHQATIAIRRVWVGPPPNDSSEAQMERYRGYAPQGAMQHWGADELISGADGNELAGAIADFLAAGGCDAVNLRIHMTGLTPADIDAQIERHASETVPALRHLLSA